MANPDKFKSKATSEIAAAKRWASAVWAVYAYAAPYLLAVGLIAYLILAI